MLIINGKIITMDGSIIPEGYVYIEGDIISEVGEMSGCRIEDSHVYDVRGKLVLPGFIDAHCHLGMWEDGIGSEGDDGNEDTDPVTPQLRAIDGINPQDRAFSEALGIGITTVVSGPGSTNVIAGQFAALHTAGSCVDDMLLSANAGMKFSLGENPKSSYEPKGQSPITRMAVAALIREQLYKTRQYADSKQKEETVDYCDKSEALISAAEGKTPSYFHAHRTDDIFTAMRIGEEFGLDTVIIHATDGHLIPDVLSRKSSKVIIGPIICDRSKPELANHSIDNAVILSAHNIPFALCTDHPETPAQYLWLCCKLLMERGLTFEQVLAAVTIDAARICGLDDIIGSLSAGKLADIVIFDEKELEKLLPSPFMVIIKGEICISAKG